MLSIHLELLDKERRKVFENLRVFSEMAVLGGGTALALQIAHRLSFDFDLFLDRQLERKDFLKLKKAFKLVKVEINTPEQLTVITDSNVDITLLYYPYSLVFPKVITSTLPLCAVEDIVADKAYTVGRRALGEIMLTCFLF